MKKWEYMSEYNVTDTQLNRYGADGWELVSVTEDVSRDRLFFLKREVLKC